MESIKLLHRRHDDQNRVDLGRVSRERPGGKRSREQPGFLFAERLAGSLHGSEKELSVLLISAEKGKEFICR
ncbi:hypothetical protein Acy02nite_47430 [Actinoplanes cyaneus]|uniref:Uncharacterized protein n=1 Tax=Actinoplanes cyaneus TaxID=52696 RepID=A0A919M5N7_9ACTN|nr:hypothetical protein [Actinoplanes cyaneus]GID66862.1 hypothetical protein Acy02nite_47430 [Actinoplanes cyaneus]